MLTNEKRKPRYTRSLNNYTRYSGMAFEMMFIIAIGVFGGVKLDARLQTKPVFSIIGSLAGIAIAFYVVIKNALHFNKTDHGEKDTD